MSRVTEARRRLIDLVFFGGHALEREHLIRRAITLLEDAARSEGSNRPWSELVDTDGEVRAAIASRNTDLERDQWIARHGSDRLKRCAALGLVEQCRGVYLDERLQLEAPPFVWARPPVEESEIRNPSEAALVALASWRVTWPDAQLVKVRLGKAGPGGPWQTAIRVDSFPWAPPGKIAYYTIPF